MRKIFTTFLLSICVLSTQAQNDSVRPIKGIFDEKLNLKIPDSVAANVPRSIISARFGIHPYVGVDFEFLFTPRIGLELFAGVFSAGGGGNIYLPGLHKDTGLKIGFQGAYSSIPWVGEGAIVYVPIGMYYIRERKFLSFDIGYQTDPFKNYGNLGFSIRAGRL